jgi:hypothetical protein
LKKVILLSLVILTSCTTFFRKKSERVLARVHDEYLYESDIKGIVPPGTLPKDSISLVRGFLDSWVRQRLVIQQAEKNLTSEQKDFAKQLESYRNSLVIYEYENALVRQKLDTVISDEEIQTYYDANQQNFLLKENIVQIQYVKLPLKSPSISPIRRLLMSDNPDDRNRLADLCEKKAADYFLDDKNWLLFNDLLKQVPVKTYNQEEFLKNHRDLEYQDSLFTYLVRFRDFKMKESVSPLNFEKQRVHDILLNKRKIDLISRMHEDLYARAAKNNDFEIY